MGPDSEKSQNHLSTAQGIYALFRSALHGTGHICLVPCTGVFGSSRHLAGFISPDSVFQGFETVVAGRDPVVAGLAHYVRSLAEAAVADMEKAPGPSKLAWNEPSLEELLTIRGGYAQKSWPAQAYKEVVHGYGEVTFVHISKKRGLACDVCLWQNRR